MTNIICNYHIVKYTKYAVMYNKDDRHNACYSAVYILSWREQSPTLPKLKVLFLFSSIVAVDQNQNSENHVKIFFLHSPPSCKQPLNLADSISCRTLKNLSFSFPLPCTSLKITNRFPNSLFYLDLLICNSVFL